MTEKRSAETKRPSGGPGRGPGRGPGGHHGGTGEKAKNFRQSFIRLVSYLGKHKVPILIVMLMAVGASVFSILGPKILGTATQTLVDGFIAKQMGGSIDFQRVGEILMVVLGLYVISGMFTFVQQYTMAGLSQRIVFGMRNEIKIKLDKLPLKYFDGRTHGEVLSRVTNDIDTIANTLQQSVTQVTSAVATLIGITVMMLTISPLLTLVTILVVPFVMILTQMVMKRSQRYFKQQQLEIGNVNGHVEEMYTGHSIVKAFNKEEEVIEDFDEINNRLYTVGWKAQFLSGLIWPITNLISNFGYVIVCVVGGVMAINGQINIGNIQAFIQYSRRFNQPIAQTAQIANVMQSAIAAAERVFEILDEDEEISVPENAQSIDNPKGAVSFEHVKFGYDEGITIIKDMNLNVEPGQVIAIVGPTGAGKTTLVNLLMRFYDIGSGSIHVDGLDTAKVSKNELRQEFGMVLQDTWLFNGTIKDNIAYGRDDATDEEIYEAAKMAHADHFIRTLPEGYDTVLNEEASNISQGQKQLLTIARALLADPTILILDEATSSVDTRTEQYIQNAMIKLMEGRTNFVIAHRLSTIRDANTILVMNDGEVIEQGNHEQLMQQKGFYADLYNSQFTTAETA